MEEQEFLVKYNELIGRLKKADKYITENVKAVESPKILNEYHSILRSLSKMENEYKRITGQEMELENKFNGFEI